MTSMRWLALALVSVLACGDDDMGADGGMNDTGVEDTGVGDTGVADTGRDAGEDAGEDDAGADASADAGARVCGDVVEVASVEELVALAPTSWGRAPYDSQWAATADLRATASFMVTGSDFTVPDDCTAPSCTPDINPSVRGTVTGVSGSSGTVAITSDALFRLRFNIQFLAPLSDFPLVVFEDACASECEGTETRCDEDESCYSTGRQYCRACDHESAMRCACVDDEGNDQPDGTSCTYITGDIGNVGTCSSGICVP